MLKLHGPRNVLEQELPLEYRVLDPPGMRARVLCVLCACCVRFHVCVCVCVCVCSVRSVAKETEELMSQHAHCCCHHYCVALWSVDEGCTRWYGEAQIPNTYLPPNPAKVRSCVRVRVGVRVCVCVRVCACVAFTLEDVAGHFFAIVPVFSSMLTLSMALTAVESTRFVSVRVGYPPLSPWTHVLICISAQRCAMQALFPVTGGEEDPDL